MAGQPLPALKPGIIPRYRELFLQEQSSSTTGFHPQPKKTIIRLLSRNTSQRFSEITDTTMKFLFDLFPIVLFFVAYKMYDIYVATAVAIGAAFLQTGLFWLKNRKFEKMHVITLAILIVFGGLTLILRDPVFIKWKPTVVNWLFGVTFLGSRFIGGKTLVERMMSHAITAPVPVWQRLNWAWVTFFVAMGVLNIYVAYNFSEDTWVNFKLFGMMGLTLIFVFGQAFYLSRYMETEEEAE